jgi:hypothetical protein
MTEPNEPLPPEPYDGARPQPVDGDQTAPIEELPWNDDPEGTDDGNS